MKKRQLLSLIFLLLFLTGCVGQRDPSPTDGILNEKESAAPAEISDAADIDDISDVLLVDQPGDYSEISSMIDGSVSFEADSATKASVDFPADGTEKSITLTDGNGLTWELVIPADALSYPQTITMTAMKNIKSSLGVISGGIVLEPDGLNFAAPVKLSVKGETVGASGLIFSGNSKGEKLELPIALEEQDSVGIMLFHFSTAYAAGDQQVLDTITREAEGSIRKLSALAKQILSRPIEVPIPPAISLKCHHDTEDQDNEKINKYLKEFQAPEVDLINALIAARRRIAFTTGTSTEYTVELQLIRRVIKKANKLFRQYRGQEDMYRAVAAAVLSAEKQTALLGESLDEDHSFIPALAEWAKSIAQKYLDELVENHQYKNIHPIMKLINDVSVYDPTKPGDLLEQLEKAVTFELETMNTVKIGVAPSIMTYAVESKATIMGLGLSENGVAEGKGSGTYKSFEVPPLEGSELDLTLDQLGKSFNILVRFEGFLPCRSNTFNIIIDRFGAESETLTAIVPEVPPTTKTKPVVQLACEKGFADKNQGGFYAFAVTLRDGQKAAVDETFPASDMGMEINFKVKLTHMP